MKNVFFLICFVMLFSCNKYIYVDDVTKGENLENSTEVTVNDFFLKRMENKLRKANVGNYEILFEDSGFVYFGKPRLKGLFSQKRILDTLFKTNFEKLSQQLPSYKKVEGFILKQNIYELIEDYKSKKSDTSKFYVDEIFKAFLTDSSIKIDATITLYQTNEKQKFEINLNKQNLELMNITKTDNFEKFYPFDDYYINLETLERVETDGILAKNFKTESIYSFRFYAPNNWIDNYYQSVFYKNCQFTIESNKSIKITDNLTNKSIQIPDNEKNLEFDNTVGNHFLVATETGVIEIKKLEGENGYKLYKYDETGKQLFKLQFEHTEVVKQGNTNYHNPYLTYFTCTNDFMVFVSYNSKYKKTLLIDLINGKISTFDYTFNGVIRTDNENNIPGFIEINESNDGFKTLILNRTWKAKIENLGDNTAETLVNDSILVVSFYHSISTGSSLYAYNLTTGELFWKADVKQLLADHSEYYNTVLLSSYYNYIIMEGIEAYGKYLQIFDIKTGERVFSSF